MQKTKRKLKAGYWSKYRDKLNDVVQSDGNSIYKLSKELVNSVSYFGERTVERMRCACGAKSVHKT